jgi:hypothetical protein
MPSGPPTWFRMIVVCGKAARQIRQLHKLRVVQPSLEGQVQRRQTSKTGPPSRVGHLALRRVGAATRERLARVPEDTRLSGIDWLLRAEESASGVTGSTAGTIRRTHSCAFTSSATTESRCAGRHRPQSTMARLPSRRRRNCMLPPLTGKQLLALWNALPRRREPQEGWRSRGVDRPAMDGDRGLDGPGRDCPARIRRCGTGIWTNRDTSQDSGAFA